MSHAAHNEELLKHYHFEPEVAEMHSGVSEQTGFPKPEYFYRLSLEAEHLPIEEAYFWILDELHEGWSFNRSVKITDINAASESSSFFGVNEQRLGVQQDKAAQYLRGISEMLKALFQIVRELRIIDERLGYYDHTFSRANEQEAVGSEITLKGIWVDQVEGGVKNAASVYGLSQTVGFTVLPDLFFRVRANDEGLHELAERDFDAATNRVVNSVDEVIAKMEGFNEKVKEVLGRKLVQYYMWKLRTYKELKTRRRFTIKYMRQHYDTIKLYMGWIKPYLRNIQRLQMADKLVQKDVAELVSAFEAALVEVEVLNYKDTGQKYKPVVLVHYQYRTLPKHSYIGEGYQRGPQHVGKFDIILRGYVWTEDQITNFKNFKEEEEMELLSTVDESIKASMDALGDELKEYLREAGEKFPDDPKPQKKEKPKTPSVFSPFAGIAGGLKEITEPFAGIIPRRGARKPKGDPIGDSMAMQAARADLKRSIFQTYKNYKKMHGMMTW